jgi:hypothetical protein
MRLIETLTKDQHRALENLRAAAARIWERPLHRYFTDHGVTHSERICTLLDGLTAGMMQTDKRLVPTEAFVLLAAASLHDIGMQDERFAGGDLEEIRAHHHEQTAEMIYQVFEDPQHAFPIPLGDDPALVEAIALVAEGHRKVDLAGGEYAPLQLGDETLRLRLLAALLRFADELDIDHRRVDLEQMKLLNLPVESQLHWWRCHYVAGVSIVDEYIRVAYRFPKDRPDYENLIIPLVENGIRAKHADLETIFRANAVKVAIGEPQVRLMRLVKPLPEEVEALARGRFEENALPPKPPVTISLQKTFRELLNEDQIPLGRLLHWAAKTSLSDLSNTLAIVIMASAAKQAAKGRLKNKLEDELNQCANDIERIELAKFIAPLFASDFLKEFPTRAEAERKFDQLVTIRSLLDKSYSEQRVVVEQWLDLTLDEGKTLLAALPLVRDAQDRLVKRLSDENIMPAKPQSEESQKPATVFNQQDQQVNTQINVAGDYHAPPAQSIHITGDGNVVGDHSSSRVVKSGSAGTTASGQINTALLRRRLRRLDSVEIESLCLDHFPRVYDKFARGLQRGEMINLLLVHCHRHPEDAKSLNDLLT